MTDTNDATPDAVIEQMVAFREEHAADGETLFAALFTPRARAAILDVLVGHPTDTMTATQIIERAGIAQSSFARQKDALLDSGVMERGEKMGNASTYRLNTEHPVAQLLGMLDQVLRFGTTAELLEEQFIGTPSGEQSGE